MKSIEKCRACEGVNLVKYFDLGDMPLANNLKDNKIDAINSERFPLDLQYCQDCTLSQLSVVIEPEELYSHYVYRSSMSQDYKDHCREMAETIHEFLPQGHRPFIIDIAGNDGALLLEFRKIFDHVSLNIDPARNLCTLALDSGIASYKAFWSLETARQLFNNGDIENKYRVFEYADIIIATNVFAHVDDVKDFIKGIEHALSPRGVFIVEFPYITDFIKRAEFDTIYHEHLSYFGLTAFNCILKDSSLTAFNVEKFSIHGGTIRIYVCKKDVYAISNNIYELQKEESILREINLYEEFMNKSQSRLEHCESLLRVAIKDNKSVACFGASAKGNTFLNALSKEFDNPPINEIIKYIIDETPEKVGKFSPGNGLEIISLEKALSDPPDIIINLVWNFQKEIENKLRSQGFHGDIHCI